MNRVEKEWQSDSVTGRRGDLAMGIGIGEWRISMPLLRRSYATDVDFPFSSQPVLALQGNSLQRSG